MIIWEHEFSALVEASGELKTFVSGLDLQERLDPRDSFFGGRTNAAKLFHEADPDEDILYMDFTSLYPSVNKFARYPLGHPSIITRDFKPLSQYFGIAKVKVLAPRGLFHPVLPYKSNSKLKFALCRTCADSEQQDTCQHNDDQRSFVGTWCTPEISKALEKGYVLVKTYEVYHWEESTQYDPNTKVGGIFTQYVDTFLKIKQESSGWPAWCKTQTDKDKYVHDYFEHEGIQLDPTKIKKNPGLRAMSKLQLNSFWGKYGQRPNMPQTTLVHADDLETLYTILTDPTKHAHDFHIMTDKLAQIQWTHKTNMIPENDASNIFVATFTTCFARLKLYGLLDMLQERILYYDTDSVVFTSKPGEQNPPLGDYLGDLTDELEGDPIKIFVSGGPKNYAYQTKSGKQTCKVRGFNLNPSVNSTLINFQTMEDMVLTPDRSGSVDVVNPSKISRDKHSAKLYNRWESKMYRLVYTKRVVLPDLNTLPYGY